MTGPGQIQLVQPVKTEQLSKKGSILHKRGDSLTRSTTLVPPGLTPGVPGLLETLLPILNVCRSSLQSRRRPLGLRGGVHVAAVLDVLRPHVHPGPEALAQPPPTFAPAAALPERPAVSPQGRKK